MRYPKASKAKNRESILEAAGRELRLKGFRGIGVDGLARAAGLTSGAFYGQFSSKEELLKEVLRRGFEQLRATFDAAKAAAGRDWVRAYYVDAYLSSRHVEGSAQGCLIPALGGDVARSAAGVKKIYETVLAGVVNLVADGLRDRNPKTREKKAWAIVSTAAGAVSMARSLPVGKARQGVLEAARETIEALLRD